MLKDSFHLLALLSIITLLILLIYLGVRRFKDYHEFKIRDLKLKNILQTIPDYIFCVSISGGIKAFQVDTEKSLQLFGCNIVGSSIQEQFPEVSEKILELVETTLEKDAMQLLEISHSTGGENKIIEMRFIKSAPDEVIVVVRDFSNEKRILESLRKSENRYRGLIESQIDFIVRIDTEGRFLFVNDAYCEKFGKTRDELIGSSFQPLVHKDDIAKTIEAMKGLSEPPYRVNLEQRAKAKDGWCWIEWEDYAIHDKEGNIAEIQGIGRDITAHKNTLDALHASEKLSRAVWEQSPIGISIRNRFGKLISYNQAWQNIWQLNDEQIREYMENERNDFKLDERDAYLGDWSAAVTDIYLNGGQLHIPELYASRRGKWISHYFYALQDDAGHVQEVVILTEDITTRKRYEDEIQKSEERYRTLIDNLPVGVYRSTTKDGLISVNQTMARIYGYDSSEEMVLKNPSTHYLDIEIRHDMIRELQEKGAIINRECEMIKADGEKIHVLSSSRAVKDEKGAIQYIDGFDLDITDRFRAVEALRESEEKFRFVANNTPVGIFIYVGDKLVYANPEASLMTGYTLEELDGITYIDLVSPEMKEVVRDRGRRRLLGEDVARSYEISLIKKNGDVIWTYFTGGRVVYNGESATIGTLVDITEKKSIEEKIKQYEIEKYNQVKEIAGGVAHEIYNSLFPAVTSLEKLRQRNRLTSDEELKRNLSLIELSDSAITRAISLTELVLEFSRLDQQKDVNLIPLSSFVKRYVNENKQIYQDNNISVNLVLSETAGILMNENHLYSLINNIMINAIDAFEGVTDKSIDICIKDTPGYIEIIISDTGKGIPAEHLQKIFNPFFSTRPKTGTGLGLAICKKISELYNGEITVSSQIDKGTKFIILFKT